MKDSRRSSTTDSDNEHLDTSKLSQRDKANHSKTKPVHNSTDDEMPSARPHSPNIQQIVEHNPVLATKKTENHGKL
jgi:hypothetical protein